MFDERISYYLFWLHIYLAFLLKISFSVSKLLETIIQKLLSIFFSFFILCLFFLVLFSEIKRPNCIIVKNKIDKRQPDRLQDK